MQSTDTAGIAWRRHAEQGIAARSEPVIEDWSKSGERPNFHDGCKPSPTRQDLDDVYPAPVTFAPGTVHRAHVHLFSHLFPRVRRRSFEDFRIVVIKPLNSPIAIERLNPRAHPPAEIALAVGVDFDLVWLNHQLAIVSGSTTIQ